MEYQHIKCFIFCKIISVSCYPSQLDINTRYNKDKIRKLCNL
eukprot:UN06295